MRIYWTLLVAAGALAFLILLLADREREANIDRLSNYRAAPHSALEADPEIKLATERSPYMRSERY